MKDIFVIALEMLESAKVIIIIVHPLLGVNEINILQKAIAYLPENNPVILDAERGDIGSTAAANAQAILKALNADALTMNPFMRYDALEPFLDDCERGDLVLRKTFNPSVCHLLDRTCMKRRNWWVGTQIILC